MINNYLERQIKENFPYQPTLEQEIAVKSLSEFLLSTLADEVFILRGYAGTGKTSLVGALVKTMDQLLQKSVLLAPTGRAAKVFSAYAGHPAFTIHKKIYRQQSFSNELSNFSINDNLATNTLFIVDEASMISNEGLSGSMFGTGRLLDDLVQFVYSGQGCRLLLMGDTAQLPPVGEELSPALFADALKGYGLEVREIDLTQVVRQVQESGILWNATQLRQLIAEDDCYSLPKIKITGFPDIKLVPGIELIEELTNCYDHDGMDETIVVCRSNKRANLYNNGIRAQILWREDELNTGDMLMIAKIITIGQRNIRRWILSLMEKLQLSDVFVELVKYTVFVLPKLLSAFLTRMILNWMRIYYWILCIRTHPHCRKKTMTDCSIRYLRII